MLLKYSGNAAQIFIRDHNNKYPTNVYTINGLDANATFNFFNNAYNRGTPLANGGRVIDTYILVGNNCATGVCGGLRAGGSPIPLFQTPAGLNQYLNNVQRIRNGWNPGLLQPGEQKW